MPRTLSYLNGGKAEWWQSHGVLVASGMAVGQGEMFSWLWALQQEHCLLQLSASAPTVYYRAERP